MTPVPAPRRRRRAFTLASLLVAAMLGAGLSLAAAARSDVPGSAPAQVTATPAPAAMPTPLPEGYALDAVWGPDAARGALLDPEGVDVGSDGLIAIAERGAHRVSYWHFNGDPVRTIGQRGGGDGQLEAPEDVAIDVDRDRIYVADTGNRRVQVFTRAGAFVAAWPDVGMPRGIAVGPDGRVYVADAAGHRVVLVDADGVTIATWGGYGHGPGQLDTPLGLAVGTDGLVYVADSGNQRVQWFGPDGAAIGALALDNAAAPGGPPRDVAINAKGELYVAVARGVLRFRGRQTYAETLPPLYPVDTPVTNNHEGVRRLALRPGVGLVATFAPDLRLGDWAWTLPERGFAHVIPKATGQPSSRRAHAPRRVDAGQEPYYAQVLDSTGLLRIYKRDGRWYDPLHTWPGGPGMDVAAAWGDRFSTGVLTGNQVTLADLTCFNGCPPDEVKGLDPGMMTRRGRTGDELFDYGLWLTGLGIWQVAADNVCPSSPGQNRFVPYPRSLALLDSGRGRVVLRAGLDKAYACFAGCSVETTCSVVLGNVGLNRPAGPFRSWRDLHYDPSGRLWLLARDGAVLKLDAKGRDVGEVRLAGLDARSAEALGTTGLASVVLTADGWVFKHAPDGRLLAAWSIADLAGPGEFTDVALADDDRVLVTDPANDRVLVFAPSDPPTEPLPAPPAPPCDPAPDKFASPSRLPLGDTTEVSLRLSGACLAPLDVVLVVDASCQMGGDRLAMVRQAGARLADALGPEDHLAVVTFTDQSGGARLRAGLSADRVAARAAAAGVASECLPPGLYPGARADGRIADGLRAGRDALFGPAGRPGARKALVLVSPSIFDRVTTRDRLAGSATPRVTDREHAVWEARQLAVAGVEVWTVGPGQDARDRDPGDPNDVLLPHAPDQGLLAAIAWPADRYRYAEAAALPATLGEIAGRLVVLPGFKDLEIVDRLPANMRLVPGSLQPPAEVLPDGALRWAFSNVTLAEVPRLRYRVEPLAAGVWPTNIEAVARFTDGLGRAGQVTFPVPTVEVVALVPTPTGTQPPTATDEPTPTAPASATAPPTAPPTTTERPAPPTPGPAVLHLPLLIKQHCVPRVLAVDVALVLDTSSSMEGAKLAAAVAAARTFVGLLNEGQDRAAVVTFDSAARLVQGLTSDHVQLSLVLAELTTTGQGTRIDLGLTEAVAELTGPWSRPGAADVIVLLTDGRPDAGTEADVDAVAAAARARQIQVYAIGLGEDVLPDVLLGITGIPARVYLAPSPTDLEAIYRDIARVIPCR